MEDFIRLNLNATIWSIAFLIVIFIIYAITKKNVEKQYRKYVNYSLFGILGIFVFVVIFTLTSQASVNNLPKSEIDRSFTKQSQNDYENKVLENSKKDVK